jgi:hypothetical protein
MRAEHLERKERCCLESVRVRFLLFACALFLIFSLPSAAYADGALKDADVTAKKVRQLLSEYSPDALYIINHSGSSDEEILRYWNSGNLLTDCIDTMVHEEFHVLTGRRIPNARSEAIYIGNGKRTVIHFTPLIDSSETAATIPQSNRTFRFNTYIMGSNSASNKLGVYGLLNEFGAYCWGLDTTVSLFPYFRQHAENYDDWYRFIVEGENDRNAYAEFLYWTLNYLEFTRVYHRDVYDKIMSNKKYVRTVKKINRHFAQKIRQYEEYHSWISSSYPNRSYSYRITDAYELLRPAINADQFAVVRRKLGIALLPQYR